jgi:ubiquinone/menaquinone biosynthesis C-methylase UbiE
MDDHDVGHFERWSSRYDRSVLQRFFFGPIQEATIAEVDRESGDVDAVLDVGCGTGQLLRRLAERHPDAELVGVDPAPGMVRQAQAASAPEGHIEFIIAGAEKLPFSDAHFDLVVTTVSFHHWADQQQGLHEVRRVLRNGGLFVLTDGLAGRWLRWPFAFRRNEGRLHTPDVLDGMLAAQRLRTVRRVPVPWRRQVKITLARAAE